MLENKEFLGTECVVLVNLVEQLRNELINNSGIYPRKLIENILQNREQVTPVLLENLERFTNSSPRDLSKEHWLEGVAALAILAKFREIRTYPYAIKLCMLPHHTTKFFLSDVTTELLPLVLASTFDGDLNSLCSIVKNQHFNEFARGAALTAIVILFRYNKISREKIISIFDSLLDELYDDFSYVPSKLVSDCADIRAIELSEKINKYFKAEIIDEFFVSPEDIQASFVKSEKEVMQELEEDYFYSFLDDLERAIGYLFRKKKDDDDENDCSEKDEDLFEDDNPFVRAEAKVGRNQKCPCGSGKKYKKCCANFLQN